jgi:hypothetical protein
MAAARWREAPAACQGTPRPSRTALPCSQGCRQAGIPDAHLCAHARRRTRLAGMCLREREREKTRRHVCLTSVHAATRHESQGHGPHIPGAGAPCAAGAACTTVTRSTCPGYTHAPHTHVTPLVHTCGSHCLARLRRRGLRTSSRASPRPSPCLSEGRLPGRRRRGRRGRGARGGGEALQLAHDLGCEAKASSVAEDGKRQAKQLLRRRT